MRKERAWTFWLITVKYIFLQFWKARNSLRKPRKNFRSSLKRALVTLKCNNLTRTIVKTTAISHKGYSSQKLIQNPIKDLWCSVLQKYLTAWQGSEYSEYAFASKYNQSHPERPTLKISEWPKSNPSIIDNHFTGICLFHEKSDNEKMQIYKTLYLDMSGNIAQEM